MRPVASIIVLTVMLPLFTEAQGQSVVTGTRVRVTAPNFGLDKHVTTVTELRGDSVVVGVKGQPRAIALSDVSALEVSAGKRMRVLPYALLGLGVGAIGGYAIGYAAYDGGSYLSNSPDDEGKWVGAMLGVVGLFTGAVAGVFHRGDNWVSATPPARATVGITRTGASIGFTRAFQGDFPRPGRCM